MTPTDPLQVLFPALQALRSHPSFVAPTIYEPFLRRYQVLPGRCHPEMQGMASGGLILSCIRVLENAEAQAISVSRRGKKRPAAAAAAAGTSSGGGTSQGVSKSASAVTSADEAGQPEKKRAKVEAALKEGGDDAELPVRAAGGSAMEMDTPSADA